MFFKLSISISLVEVVIPFSYWDIPRWWCIFRSTDTLLITLPNNMRACWNTLQLYSFFRRHVRTLLPYVMVVPGCQHYSSYPPNHKGEGRLGEDGHTNGLIWSNPWLSCHHFYISYPEIVSRLERELTNITAFSNNTIDDMQTSLLLSRILE